MEMIKRYNGRQEIVWTSAKEYLRNEPILADAGENWTSTTLLPNRTSRELWIHCIHTGAAAEFLVALANENSSCAAALVMKGAGWEIKSIMEAAARSVREVFPDATFREGRSIVMDIGKATYKALGELNKKITLDEDKEHLSLCMEIDPYQPLLDVDWIEDRMTGMER